MQVAIGESMMEAAHANDIDLEGGAPEGLASCRTGNGMLRGMLLLALRRVTT